MGVAPSVATSEESTREKAVVLKANVEMKECKADKFEDTDHDMATDMKEEGTNLLRPRYQLYGKPPKDMKAIDWPELFGRKWLPKAAPENDERRRLAVPSKGRAHTDRAKPTENQASYMD